MPCLTQKQTKSHTQYILGVLVWLLGIYFFIQRQTLLHIALHLFALSRLLVTQRALTVSARTGRSAEKSLHLLHVQY